MTIYGESYTRYQLDRGRVRMLVRRLYLDAAVRKLQGPTVDFGCGVGELLQRLPPGSVGLEINPVSVEHCQSRGLDALVYDGEEDDWSLGVLGQGKFQSLVVSHVLEHLELPISKLNRLLRACARLGIGRAVVIVPGLRGYASDSTHRTFIDLAMLSAPEVVDGTSFAMSDAGYFPGNFRALGALFPHHELQVTFEAITKARVPVANE